MTSKPASSDRARPRALFDNLSAALGSLSRNEALRDPRLRFQLVLLSGLGEHGVGFLEPPGAGVQPAKA